MIFSKKQLAVSLSRLQNFESPSWRLEQYSTDSEIAAEIIWFAYQNQDIENKIVADLGCGTGTLGIGTLFFNPSKVFFVDIDERQLKHLETNLKLQEFKDYEVICSDITKFDKKVDIVFQNPPFGVKNIHADKTFLEKAFNISNVIYSFHKIESKNFIEQISKNYNFVVTHFFKFEFPLKQTMNYHTKRIQRIGVGCWRLQRKTL
jgi:putative methylase